MPKSAKTCIIQRDSNLSSEGDFVMSKVEILSMDRILKIVKNEQVEQLQRLLKDEFNFFTYMSTLQWKVLLDAVADICRIEHLDVLLKRSRRVSKKSAPAFYSRALRAACLQNNLAVIEQTLKRGAAVDAAGDDGLPCLHIAAKKQNIDAMQLLLKNGADINQCTSLHNKHWPNSTALRLSCAEGHRDAIGFLLEHGASILVAGRNALADAACNVCTLEAMLNEYGVNIDIADASGQTALWQACFSPYPEYPVTALLQHGANPNIIALLRNTPSAEPLLPFSCSNGRLLSVVELLLSHGAAVNVVDSYGLTALMYACYRGGSNAVKLLLDYGADVNVVDKDGKTALMHIVERGRFSYLPMLIGHEADVLIPYTQGRYAGKTVLDVFRYSDSKYVRMVRVAAERQALCQPVLK